MEANVFGIFDGHGGKQAATFVSKHLSPQLLKALSDATSACSMHGRSLTKTAGEDVGGDALPQSPHKSSSLLDWQDSTSADRAIPESLKACSSLREATWSAWHAQDAAVDALPAALRSAFASVQDEFFTHTKVSLLVIGSHACHILCLNTCCRCWLLALQQLHFPPACKSVPGQNCLILTTRQLDQACKRVVETSAICLLSCQFRQKQSAGLPLTQFVHQVSGTTATVAVLVGWELLIANVGDSLAFLDTGSEVIQVSGNHRLDTNKAEQARLREAGCEVSRSTVEHKPVGPLRVWPGGLAMGRTLGDSEVGLLLSAPPSKASRQGSRLSIRNPISLMTAVASVGCLAICFRAFSCRR